MVPESLTGLRRWACADGKRPVRADGRAASSTNPETWSDYASVANRPHGVMLGDGLACWDLDNVIGADGTLHPNAVAVLAEVTEPLWVERSMSGRGLHVFVHGEGPTVVGTHASYYTHGRFIVVTGERYWPQVHPRPARAS